MISFECDYNNGAHPKVLQQLVATNGEQSLTYGFDTWSEQAKAKIKLACGREDAEVYLLTGGTQTNATVIDSVLQPYEAVITIDSGHINVHEAGAIEAWGHKVIAMPNHDGKLEASDLDLYMEDFEGDETCEHLAQPGLVYISFPTEYGTIYTASELEELYGVCRKHGLRFYIDGARLGYGLMARGNDVSMEFLANHCDVFYIGGTKVGTLCGEAVVFTNLRAPKHFFTIIKRHGALLAKGRLTGIQFNALFTDNLYFDISKHAIDMAEQMKELFRKRGYQFYIDSPTNQQFVIIDNKEVERLSKQVLFSHWGPCGDSYTICRFVTSWATTEEDLKVLKDILDDK